MSAKFPATPWDGVFQNPSRKNILQESEPDWRDWVQLLAEVIAMQTFMYNELHAAAFDMKSGNIAVATDVANWLYVPVASTLTRVAATIKTAPVTSDAIFDVYMSIDGGATFTSIWASTTANRVTIAAAAHVGTQTAFDTTAIPAGAILRLDVTQTGTVTTGANACITLFMTRP